jgi:hypothetical protein
MVNGLDLGTASRQCYKNVFSSSKLCGTFAKVFDKSIGIIVTQ